MKHGLLENRVKFAERVALVLLQFFENQLFEQARPTGEFDGQAARVGNRFGRGEKKGGEHVRQFGLLLAARLAGKLMFAADRARGGDRAVFEQPKFKIIRQNQVVRDIEIFFNLLRFRRLLKVLVKLLAFDVADDRAVRRHDFEIRRAEAFPRRFMQNRHRPLDLLRGKGVQQFLERRAAGVFRKVAGRANLRQFFEIRREHNMQSCVPAAALFRQENIRGTL